MAHVMRYVVYVIGCVCITVCVCGGGGRGGRWEATNLAV